ncbi:permease of the major facilitator superfamily [Microdochium trichocladiopsis]|uniref:Permease of the major facilitator superfamily n=1 Tax=Microdochium trichocladiopsis TaxID=1682393 RepID=A0A9P9BTP2_9PEZI|nr:permease of the major facilitator superfamily [Microdochium trichocladiopsis]KAH7035687.1 permease of the major facilitator superfamily [Microdochium trichocladiopsis]
MSHSTVPVGLPPQDVAKTTVYEAHGDAESLRPGPGAGQVGGNGTSDGDGADDDDDDETEDPAHIKMLERRLRRKVDLRLCTIAGILCSLNLLDSGVISSAAVTSMPADLGLEGNRFSVSIFIFTIASIAFQLPSTIACRTFGPRLWFSFITFCFGLITMCTAFIQTWQQMIALRVLLGVAMSGIYPGLSYLISVWYPRREQQTRFAFLQSGEVIILATGSIVNYGLNQLDGRGGIAGWRYMFLVQGIISMAIGILTYFWIVDFPENAHKSFYFLTPEEQALAVKRINADRHDVEPDPFAWSKIFIHALDPKVYGFAVMFFLLNLVSTSLSYFLPIILQSGMGFSANEAILLSAPPYYYAVIPVLLSSIVGDKYNLRGPVIIFNCLCLVVGFCMLGFASQVTVRYIGTYLATGAYISNWAALSTYQANNIAGQWKRVFTAATVAAMNGAGGIAGSFIVRSDEAPGYITAVWVSIGSHLGIIFLVGVFSVWFWSQNKLQGSGKLVLEGVRGFKYTF